MKNTFNDLLFMLGLLIGGLIVANLSGCGGVRGVGAASPSHPVQRDHFPSVAAPGALCDFGILRGTSSMRCVDEFKRKGWPDGLV